MSKILPTVSMSAKQFGSNWAVEQLNSDYGLGLTKMSDSAEFDFRHDVSGARIELKAARSRKGAFVFQYICPDYFDVCVCLGWDDGAYSYWLFATDEIRPLLAKQHRSLSRFQLRLGPRTITSVAKHHVASAVLRERLDLIARRVVRRRCPVRLSPMLVSIEGWPRIAESVTRQMKSCKFSDWCIVVNPMDSVIDADDPDLVRCPVFNLEERRIEIWVQPKPVFGQRNVSGYAASLFDTFLMYFDYAMGEDDSDFLDEF